MHNELHLWDPSSWCELAISTWSFTTLTHSSVAASEEKTQLETVEPGQATARSTFTRVHALYSDARTVIIPETDGSQMSL